MKNKLFLSLAATAVFLVCCTQENLPAPQTEPVLVTANPYAVPVDEALAQLETVLDAIDGPATRSGGRRRVREVKAVPIITRYAGTRSGSRTRVDSAFYLVNFESNAGYAILAGDKRLDPVIAVVDQGNLDRLNVDLDAIPDAIDSLDYDPVKDDFRIGSTGLPDPRNDYEAYNEHPFDATLPLYWKQNTSGQVQGYDGWVPTTIKGAWHVTGAITPMLKTKWRQGFPFNNLAPIYGTKHAPAGCVPVAVAQIMAYHEFPADFCDWKLTKTIFGYENPYSLYTSFNSIADSIKAVGSVGAQNEVSRLLYRIGKGCDVDYGANNSSAYPVDAKNFMKDMGYRNTVRHLGYERVEILKCLERGCPVFIGARRAGGGHAWVIDGYIRREYVCTGYDTQKQLLMHCNWGYAGSADGYYISELFRTYTSAVMGEESLNEDCSDYGKYGEQSHRYYKVYRIITYDKPI